MKHNFTRLMALVLALVMVLSMAACGGEKTVETTKATTAQEVSSETAAPASDDFDPRDYTEGVTLTIAVPSKVNIVDYETALSTQMIEEELGVNLEFEVYALDTYGDKLNVMIQGGDKLPDMIWGPDIKWFTNNGYNSAWIEAGAILDLTEYYNDRNFSKHYWEEAETEGVDILAGIRDADGHVWSVPKYCPGTNDATAMRGWINTEYAAALGYDELPTTTEGFYELCKAFYEAGDMNGNGKDDEILFVGGEGNWKWFKTMMSAYVYAWDDAMLTVTDGKVDFSYATEEWKEGLKYIKQFFDDGMLDASIYTMDKTTASALQNDVDCCMLAEFYYQPYVAGDGENLATFERRLKYDYITCLEGPNGGTGSYYADPIAYPGGYITTDCENPDAAFLVMDYMLSEKVSLTNRYGEEGVDWDFYENADDSKFDNGASKTDFVAENGTGEPRFVYYSSSYWGNNPQNKGYMLVGPILLHSGTNGYGVQVGGGGSDEAVARGKFYARVYQEAIPAMLEDIPQERIITLPLSAEENSSISEASSVITKYWQEAAANFTTGVWDIDTQWDSYLAELEKIGMSDLLEVYQTSYDRTK